MILYNMEDLVKVRLTYTQKIDITIILNHLKVSLKKGLEFILSKCLPTSVCGYSNTAHKIISCSYVHVTERRNVT